MVKRSRAELARRLLRADALAVGPPFAHPLTIFLAAEEVLIYGGSQHAGEPRDSGTLHLLRFDHPWTRFDHHGGTDLTTM